MTSQSPDPRAMGEAAKKIRSARKIAVFTGAGISAESGIGTFRDDHDGLWTRFPPEEFANWDSLIQIAMETPTRAAEFFVALLEPMVQARPNAGHHAVADLQPRVDTTVITQNIDGLHEAAGSRAVHAIHGTLYETAYLDGAPRGTIPRSVVASVVAELRAMSQESFSFEELLAVAEPMMGVDVLGPYRPKIVLFGDQLAKPECTNAQRAARECDCMLLIGTSGVVFPASTLPEMAREGGATVIGVDPQPVDADIWLAGSAGSALPALVSAAFD